MGTISYIITYCNRRPTTTISPSASGPLRITPFCSKLTPPAALTSTSGQFWKTAALRSPSESMELTRFVLNASYLKYFFFLNTWICVKWFQDRFIELLVCKSWTVNLKILSETLHLQPILLPFVSRFGWYGIWYQWKAWFRICTTVSRCEESTRSCMITYISKIFTSCCGKLNHQSAKWTEPAHGIQNYD